MSSTIPAPRLDTDETREATLVRALAARMRRESTAEATAAQIAAGERPASERVPEPYRGR